MKKMGIMMAFALVLMASVAVAEVKWEQLPGGDPALWSAYDMCDEWTALAADDFLCEDGVAITAIEWWGKHVLPTCPTPQSFVIRFYTDVPDPNPDDPSDWSRPGDLLYEEEYLSFTEVSEPEYQGYHYYLALTTPFQQVADTVYWMSIEAKVCSPDIGWAWLGCEPAYYWNDEAVWTSENQAPGWYFPDWTPPSVYTNDPYYHMELAFRLISNSPTPVEDWGWGGIKAQFR